MGAHVIRMPNGRIAHTIVKVDCEMCCTWNGTPRPERGKLRRKWKAAIREGEAQFSR